jgi:2-keto-4-pentenoate hydratase
MTLTPLASHIARALVAARRSGTPWQPDVPLDEIDVEQAYAVQRAVAQELGWFAQGRPGNLALPRS